MQVMNAEIRQIKDLKNWGENPRGISKAGFNRLKNQIEELGVYKPLLITPDGTVIGGNMRLRALQSMGVKEVGVRIIEFHKQSDGLWYATIDGERKGSATFSSMESGMMAYSLSDNDRAGFYDSDLLANAMPEFDINWDNYSVDMYEPLPVSEILDLQARTPFEDTAEQIEKSKKPMKCPHCGKNID